jgi:hypothetical protein
MTDNISVSFKTSTAFDAALLNFKGSNSDEVKAAIMEFFSLGSEVVEWTAFEVFVEADRLAKAVYGVKAGLGGKVVKPFDDMVSAKPSVTVNAKPSKPTQVQPIDFTAMPPAVVSAAPAVESGLIEQINSAASKAVLAQLYSENKTVWQGDIVKAAIKRSAELA